MVNKKFEINIGGDNQKNYDLTIFGSDNQIDDFVMALVKFTSEWKQENTKIKTATVKKPCGCKDAK